MTKAAVSVRTEAEAKPKKARKPSSPIQVFRGVHLEQRTITDGEGNEITAFVQVPGETEDSFLFLSIASEAQGSSLPDVLKDLKGELSRALAENDADTLEMLTRSTLYFSRTLLAKQFTVEARIK